MRHGRTRHKLSRDAAHRKALLRNLSQAADRARADPDEPGQGQGGQARGREADHPRQAGRPACAPPAPREAGPGQVHRPQAGRGDRSPLHRAPRRLHADRQARPAPVRLDRDGLPRAGLSRAVALATYRLDLAYDGTGFSGWAVQPGLRTVQGEIEAALAQLFGEPIRLTVAGRTDAGVHALGQVAGFTTERPPPDSLVRALNGLTGPDVAISAAAPVPDGFDARRDARSRRYRYRIETGAPPSPFERGRALAWPHRMDRRLLDRCCGGAPSASTTSPPSRRPTPITGTSGGGSSRRTGRDEPGSERIVRFEIEADSFMRGMVRAIVGTMLEVASGPPQLADFEALLAAPRGRSPARRPRRTASTCSGSRTEPRLVRFAAPVLEERRQHVPGDSRPDP